MIGEKIGYIRVSSKTQNIDRQVKSLNREGVLIENIYVDLMSGKDFERPFYKEMLKRLKENDLLIIHELDRIGRNYEEIIENWRYITKEKKADIKVLSMPLLDTTIAKDLLGTFITDLVLQIFSYNAHNERLDIHRRQREGIDIALEKGIKFGRKPITLPANFEEVVEMRNDKKINQKNALKILGMKKTTYYKYKKIYEEKKK